MNEKRAGLLVAVLLLTLDLAACGGQATSSAVATAPAVPAPPTPADTSNGISSSGSTEIPHLVSASIVGCGEARVHDTGHIVYLTVSRDCNGPGVYFAYQSHLEAVLSWGTATSVIRHAVVFGQFGNAVDVEFEPGVRRTVSVYKRGTWRYIANDGTWTWRDGAGLLSKDGGLYLLGGWSSDSPSIGSSEVWFTTDLVDWRRLTPQAPWPGRHGAAWLVHQNRLYVMSGDLLDDTWSSADGVNWRLENPAAPFGGRYTPVAVSDGQNIFLYEGQYWGASPGSGCGFQPGCNAVGLNDVWQSPDGSSWVELTGHAPWNGRALVHGGAYFRGRIYVIGGGLKMGQPGAQWYETSAQFSDIWSSADGINWRLEATQLGFPPRTHFALTATPDGCYVANGSVNVQFDLSSEVFFAADCVHFEPIPDPSPMGPRHASSLVYFNGSIVVLGGHPIAAPTAIWQYFPDTGS